MTIVDRYILRLFTKVLFICFLSLTGLFIVIDAFGNLDEFLEYGEQEGGILAVLMDYYGARVLTFFERTSPVLALVAAMFAMTWMQRNNELTALMAAGIKSQRLVRPLLAAVVVVSLLSVANRELLIPSVRDKLTRNAQDWLGDAKHPLKPQFDHKTDILLGGRHSITAERKVTNPAFRCFTAYGTYGRQLIAENAVYHPPENGRPGGYLLSQVDTPNDLDKHANAFAADADHEFDYPVIYGPKETDWLEADQLFVASEVSFDHLVSNAAVRQYSSSWELLRGLRNESLDYGADAKVIFHSRLLQPLMDATLLFLGLPLVLTRRSRNVFVASGLGLLVVTGFVLVLISCHALGRNGIVSPALAAWLPLMIFGPLAFTLARGQDAERGQSEKLTDSDVVAAGIEVQPSV